MTEDTFGQELGESPIIEDFCFAIIKQDALHMGIDGIILERLESEGFIIVKRKLVILSSEQVDRIYEDLNIPQNSHFYGRMRDSIVGRPVICLIIGGNNGVTDRINQVKGKPLQQGTIRGDFSYRHLMSDEEYTRWEHGEYDEERTQWLRDQIFMHDRFHTSDGREDSLRSIQVVFSVEDISEIVERAPSFAEFIQE